MSTEHSLTVREGTHDFSKSQLWYNCSCGRSGPACSNPDQVQAQFDAHVAQAKDQERLGRIRDAAPKLLAALEEMPDNPNSLAEAKRIIWFAKDRARDAIALAEEDA